MLFKQINVYTLNSFEAFDSVFIHLKKYRSQAKGIELHFRLQNLLPSAFPHLREILSFLQDYHKANPHSIRLFWYYPKTEPPLFKLGKYWLGEAKYPVEYPLLQVSFQAGH